MTGLCSEGDVSAFAEEEPRVRSFLIAIAIIESNSWGSIAVKL